MLHVSFDSLSDAELHIVVRKLTARANIALADLLAHLGELEARGIHRSRACATLYTYCRYELRMSEDAAFRRSKAARIVHQHPELRDIVARGEIHLTGLLMIAPLLGGERHGEVLARARFRSKREIARLMAELDPKPEVPALVEPIAPAVSRGRAGAIAEAFVGLVRELPAGDRPGDWIDAPENGSANVLNPAERNSELATGGTGAGARLDVAEQELAEAQRALEGAWQATHRTQPDRPLRFRVQFTANQEYVDLLEEAIDLLGYKKKATSLPEVQLRALRELVERLRKRKRGAPAATSAAPARVPSVTDRAAAEGAAPARVADAPESATVESTAPARVSRSRNSADAENAAPERVTDASAAIPGAEPRQYARVPARSRSARGRHVPAADRRAVSIRDGARCAYMDERGRRCEETRGLELHHREPYALGGPPTEDNLELRCKAHNTLAAEEDFGRNYVDFMRGSETARGEYNEQPGMICQITDIQLWDGEFNQSERLRLERIGQSDSKPK